VVALGASWAPAQNWILDLGYQHLFFDDAPLDQVGPAGERLVGEFDNSANVVGLSLRWVR
jgi:long-chain fatty acid transport protein